MSDFTIRTESNHCRHRIIITGELDISKEVALRGAINDVIEEKMTHGDFVVVNLAQVTYIDRYSIGLLIDSWHRITAMSGSLCLVISDKITRIFEILGILKVLPIMECEAQIASPTTC